MQWRTGPSIFQPYYDIWKFFRKESVRPETASPFFELAPLIAFASYCSIALLIPVLTNFPLPARHGRRHPRRRAAVRARRVRHRTGRRRLGLGLRRAWLESDPVGRDAGRADADLRVLHGRAGHRDRPALRAERHPGALLLGVLPAQSPAGRRGVLRDAARRHRPGADREPGIDARVRDDRRRPAVRALGPVRWRCSGGRRR